jgi:hypothetical protein
MLKMYYTPRLILYPNSDVAVQLACWGIFYVGEEIQNAPESIQESGQIAS